MEYSTKKERNCGLMVSLEDALDYFILYLPDTLPEEIKTEEFCEEYQRALNRIKYETLKQHPIKPQIIKAVTRGRMDYFSCGQCGNALDVNYDYCHKCGTNIKWDSPRCLTK